MNFLKKYFVLAAGLATLTACAGSKDMNDLAEYNQDFKEQNINVFLKSFSDHRQGRDMLLPQGPKIIYAYKPQSLMNGQMLPLLGYYIYNTLDFQDEKAKKSIGIDVSVRKVETAIRLGHMPSGRMGYYSASIQARVIVRDMVGKEVIATFPIMISKNKLRNTTTGNSPSSATDRYALLNLVDELSIELADEILDEVSEITEEYYVEELDEVVFEEKLDRSLSTASNPLDKTADMKVNEVKEDSLNMSLDVQSQIEAEEEILEERKEQQRMLFEQKIREQRELDILDSKL